MSAFDEKIQPAQRIHDFKPYFFADLNRRIQTLKAQGMDVIRLDAGSPDLPPPDFIIQRLIESASRADAHGYASSGGSAAFRRAVSTYYRQRFGVELNPESEVLALIGAKEGVFHLSQALLNPGDVALVPDPGYPVYSAGGRIAGAEIYPMRLRAEQGWLPRLDDIPPEAARRAKILWLNYPNNPTGAAATMDFFAQAVAFARQWGVLIAHDAPYMEVGFDGYRAPSLLQVDGAKDVAVEFNSLSKTANMAGWRVGMVVGNAQVIRLLAIYKSQVDSAGFLPIEEAAASALMGDLSWIHARNRIYQQRRDLAVDSLQACGFNVEKPHAAIYVWARLPGGYGDDMRFCARLLEHCGVSITPGSIYGGGGQGYVRLSLCTPEERISTAMQRVRDFLSANKNGEDTL